MNSDLNHTKRDSWPTPTTQTGGSCVRSVSIIDVLRVPMASQLKRARFSTEEVVAFLDDDLDLIGEVICEGSDDELEFDDDQQE